jgi:hypothetical protein
MNEKKLIDLYKNQLAQSTEKAPEGLWDDIAGKLEEFQLISAYNEQLTESSEKAPEGLWNDISENLDELQLISAYNEQLTESSEKAPEGIWDDIAGKMDELQLISAYQEQLAQSSEDAPEGMWDDMARKMDIDEVWKGVAAGLHENKKSGFVIWFNRGIAAAIAILVISTLSLWLLLNPFSPGTDLAHSELTAPANENQAVVPTEEEPSIRQPEFSLSITGSNGQNIKDVDDNLIASAQEQDSRNQEESISQSDARKITPDNGSTTLNPLMNAGATLATLGSPSLRERSSYSLSEEESQYNLNISNANAGSGALALGFTTAMKNTWLFNHETFQGFDPGSGSRTHLKFYPDVAVSLGYQFSERWKMESNFSISSSAGQSYEQYIYGRFSQREITLRYFQAEVLAAYNHRKRWVIRSNTMSHSTYMGLYYSVLNAAHESIAGEKEDISELYKKNDYGIITGHNLNIPITGKLMFSPGIYFTWGLPNIYQAEYTLPSLKRTHNRSVELRFSVYYNFSR